MSNTQISSNEVKYKHQNPIQKYFIHRFLKAVVELVIPLGVNNIYDVGCGEGFLTAALLEVDKRLNITGIEISFISILRGNENNPTFRIINGSVYQLPFPSQSVDLVLCTEVLEHLHSPEEALIEIKRVTRKYCILSVPNEPYFMMANFFRGKNISRFGNDIEHVQHWSARSFIKLLRSNGLEICNTRNQFPWTIVLASVKQL